MSGIKGLLLEKSGLEDSITEKSIIQLTTNCYSCFIFSNLVQNCKFICLSYLFEFRQEMFRRWYYWTVQNSVTNKLLEEYLLKRNIDTVHAYDMVKVLGDFNAEVDKEQLLLDTIDQFRMCVVFTMRELKILG